MLLVLAAHKGVSYGPDPRSLFILRTLRWGLFVSADEEETEGLRSKEFDQSDSSPGSVFCSLRLLALFHSNKNHSKEQATLSPGSACSCALCFSNPLCIPPIQRLATLFRL